MIEQGVVEKFAHRDAQAVADFLNGNDAWVLAFCIQHALDRGRCDAAAVGKGIDCDFPFRAKILYSARNRLFCVHPGTTFPHVLHL